MAAQINHQTICSNLLKTGKCPDWKCSEEVHDRTLAVFVTRLENVLDVSDKGYKRIFCSRKFEKCTKGLLCGYLHEGEDIKIKRAQINNLYNTLVKLKADCVGDKKRFWRVYKKISQDL